MGCSAYLIRALRADCFICGGSHVQFTYIVLIQNLNYKKFKKKNTSASLRHHRFRTAHHLYTFGWRRFGRSGLT